MPSVTRRLAAMQRRIGGIAALALLGSLLLASAITAQPGTVVTSPESQISSPAAEFSENGVVAPSGDGFVVVWHQTQIHGEAAGIVGQSFSSTGGAIGSEFDVADDIAGVPNNPAISSRGDDGSFVVVWGARLGQAARIFGQRFDSVAQKTGTVFQISTDTSAGSPRVSAASDGSFVVVWLSETSADETEIRGRRFTEGGEPIAPAKSLALPQGDVLHELAASSAPNGDFVVAWSTSARVDYQPYFRRHFVNAVLFNGSADELRLLDINAHNEGGQGRDGLDIVHRGDGSFVVVYSDGQYSDLVPPGPFNVFFTSFESNGTPLTGC